MRFTIIFVLLLSSLALSCKKENPYLLNKPESVIWNPVTESYLISNVGSGFILSLKDKQDFSIFNKANLDGPKGMAILGNNMYVADLKRVVGFDLQTGEKTFEQKVPDASFLNDVTASDGKMIYISDSDSSFIAMLNVVDKKLEIYKDKDLIKPNGLYYQKTDKDTLLYIVSMKDNTPIKVLNLGTKVLTDIPHTEMTRADGITRDKMGEWLISSWADSTVYKYSPDFLMKSTIKEKYQSPADIFYNPVTDELAIPQMQLNRVNFITIDDSLEKTNK